MRSTLKTVAGISDIETDLDAKTCRFEVDSSVEVTELLKQLTEEDNKLEDWSFTN